MKLPLNIIGWRRTLRLKKGKAQPFVLINPTREWILSLILTVVIAVVLFGYAGYLLYMQMQGGTIVTIEDQSVAVYRRAESATHIDAYKKRADAFEALRADRSSAYVPPAPLVKEIGTTTDDAEIPDESVPLAVDPI